MDEKGIEAKIEKITDFNEFGKYGIMMTPGLVVKGARKYKGCQAGSITDNLPLTK